MNFGLVCEGITDQIVIENILCGFFNNEDDLDENIHYLQPQFDETNSKQKGFGGWEGTLYHLTLARFREDVLNMKYVIIQIDTDIAQHKNFNIPYYDKNNKELLIKQLVVKITNKLIEKIEKGELGFFEKYKNKIIFSICVHSLECWLLAYHTKNTPKKPKIQNCEKSLRYCLKNKKYKKNYSFYNKLSEPFLRKEILLKTAKNEPSLTIFLNNLAN